MPFRISFENGFERLLLLPLRMLRSQRLDPVKHETELEIEWLLSPKRAVVVEDGDAIFGRDITFAALRRGRFHEVHDAGFRGSVVPGRQSLLRKGRTDCARDKKDESDQQGCKDRIRGLRCVLHGLSPET